MLSRPGPLPSGSGWSFELKWDGFRALVSTEDRLRVRSRRGWNMTELLPELRGLPAGLVLDGELVAWKRSQPYFPLVCRRVLNRDMTVPLTYVIFDVLRHDGDDLTAEPYGSRRRTLQALKLDGPSWTTSETFEDGHALFDAVCRFGLEGVVAKRLPRCSACGDGPSAIGPSPQVVLGICEVGAERREVALAEEVIGAVL